MAGKEAEPRKSKAAPWVLSIPELLTEVLGYVHYEYARGDGDRAIFACMRVNVQWSEEAIRYVWDECGGSQPGNRCPRVRNLADMNRRQRRKYARYIRTLELGFDYHVAADDQSLFRWEGEFLPNIASLNFPHLETVIVCSPRTRKFANYRLMNRHLPTLFRKSLKNLKFTNSFHDGWDELSDGLYSNIGNRCKGLTELSISFNVWRTYSDSFVSPLARCLQNLTTLTRLVIGYDTIKSTSLQFFKTVAHHPSLQQVDLPLIRTNWIEDLRQEISLDQCCFSRLESFEARISDDGLRLLLPRLTNLKSLILCPLERDDTYIGVLGEVSLHKLTTLKIAVNEDSVVHASEFERLTEKARNLENFELLSEGRFRLQDSPLSDGFNDAIVERSIRNLPRLREFYMSLDKSECTEATLITFGKYCPNLAMLHFPAKVDFEALVNEAGQVTWPSLKNLHLDFSDSEGRNFIDVGLTAEGLQKLMPQLELPEYSDYDYGDEELVQALRRLKDQGDT